MKEIFLMILFISLEQLFSVNSIKGPSQIPLREGDVKEIENEAKNFGESIALGGMKEFWKTDTEITIKTCYDRKKNEYKREMKSFVEKMFNIWSEMNSVLKMYYYDRSNAVRDSLVNINNTINSYPDNLSEKLKTISKALTLMDVIIKKLNDHLKDFLVKLVYISKTGGTIEASEYHFKFKEVYDGAKSKSIEIVEEIKKCKGIR